MAIPSDGQILAWRTRWVGKEQLIDNLITILKGGGKVKTSQEAKRRLNEANDLLTANGFPPVEEKIEIVFIFEIITVPALDLRGIGLTQKRCNEICLLGAHLEGAGLYLAHLEGADLFMAHLEGADLFRVHLEGADLFMAHLEGAVLREAHLEEVVLSDAHLEGTVLFRAHLEGADLINVHLEGAVLFDAHLEGAYFNNAHVGKLTIDTFDSDCQLSKEEKEKLITKRNITAFTANDFLPRWRDHFFHKSDRKYTKLKKPEWKKILLHIKDRWNYTKFAGVRIDDADTTMAADLYRYVKDQQFLQRFKERHPVIYRIWWLFSDCGGKLSVVFFWAAVIMIIYAVVYCAMNMPAVWWMPEFLQVSEFPINPIAFFDDSNSIQGFWKWLFISFDIFSNLGLRSTQPQNFLGVFLVLSESVLGFMMLGMLISVIANRFARRS